MSKSNVQKEKESNFEVSKEITKFLDKTNQKWFSKAGSNRITFCNSIDDIIDGKGESFEFSEKILSLKITNKNGKEIEYNHLYLFILIDGRFIVCRRWDELK